MTPERRAKNHAKFMAMIERTRAWKLLREQLCGEQNHRCAYCGVRFGAAFRHWTVEDTIATVDHVIPKSLGGSNRWENLVAACRRCNALRKAREARFFFEDRGWIDNKHDRELERTGYLARAIRNAQPVNGGGRA